MTTPIEKLIADGLWPTVPKSVSVDAAASVAFARCYDTVETIAKFVRAHMEYGGESLEHAIAGALADTPPVKPNLANALKVAADALEKYARPKMIVPCGVAKNALAEINRIAEGE
jgi:hypothetical protein